MTNSDSIIERCFSSFLVGWKVQRQLKTNVKGIDYYRVKKGGCYEEKTTNSFAVFSDRGSTCSHSQPVHTTTNWSAIYVVDGRLRHNRDCYY